MPLKKFDPKLLGFLAMYKVAFDLMQILHLIKS